jgi:hypothetical protein
MKFNLKYTPIALAVLTFGMSPSAYTEEGGDNGDGPDRPYRGGSHASVYIDKEIKYSQDVDIEGRVRVNGLITIDNSSAAIVNDEQHNYNNTNRNRNGIILEGEGDDSQRRIRRDGNYEVTNESTVDGNAMSDASGNIGLNVAAGDGNQQANAAALASADASFLFGSVDAEIVAVQAVYDNNILYRGNTNVASISGEAFSNASGNIGANIASGNNNQQKNDLAVSVGVARMSTATVSVNQRNYDNTTVNVPIDEEIVVRVPVNLGFSATGDYAGIVDQNGDLYPDIWDNSPGDDPVHPTDLGGPSQHADFDDEAQGASDRPVSSGLDAAGNPNGDLSDGGALGFNEQGDIALSGSVTGFVPVVQRISLATTNTSHLGDNAFSGAAGNIGVNIASGTNNQQHNGLAISNTQAGIGGGNGGGGEL